TLDFTRFAGGRTIGGIEKIHLNNSVEDPSFLDEFIGGELFRAAGVPAPRVAYALVELNGRKLGLYVVKEGLSTSFLSRHFTGSDGNLYDTDWGHEISQPMKNHSHHARASGQPDLQELVAATQEKNSDERWRLLSRRVDLDRFVSFVAMEVLACHCDGYSLARNNFAIYHDPSTDHLIFLPSGMDQLFGKAD